MGLFVFAAIVVFAVLVLVDLAGTLLDFARAQPDSPRPLCVLARILAASSALWIVTFALLVVRAWVAAGEMPVAEPGPFVPPDGLQPPNIRASEFPLHWQVVFLGLFALPLASGVALAAWSERRAWRERAERSRLVDSAACLGGILVIMTLDPGGFWHWFTYD